MIVLCAMQPGNPAAEVGSINNEILDYFKLIAILAGILVLAVFALRVWLPRLTGARSPGSGAIRVAARLALEPRKNLYILKTGADYFLVATSESGVHWLSALDGERIEPFLPPPEPPAGGELDFARLTKAFRRPKS